MEFRELLYKRRSIRSFTGEKMTRSQLGYILEAATRAPSACNYQSWHFTVIVGEENIAGLYPEIYRGEWIRNASAVIVVQADDTKITERFGDRGRELFALQDTACAMNNILLAAADIGFGGCFIGAFDEDRCTELLGLKYRPVAIAALGKPTAEPALRERKPMDDVVDWIGEPIEDGEYTETPADRPFEISDARLPGAKFTNLDLGGAVFDDVNLGGAGLNNINLSGAKYTDINMSGASFTGMTMAGSSFGCVDMQNCQFENPDFTGSVFRNCTLKNITIENCELDGITVDGRAIEL
ncbi:MAG: nitroreductase family protein [Clostridia bacterium]|nr:nitroreductase family protein [Clostridia bacterium]